jgi:hypothetical protein
MSEYNDNLDREIEKGIARAERMLRRQRMVRILTGLAIFIFITGLSFWQYSDYQQNINSERATLTDVMRLSYLSSTANFQALSTQSAESTATYSAAQTATSYGQVSSLQTVEAQKTVDAWNERDGLTGTAIVQWHTSQTQSAVKADSLLKTIQSVIKPYVGDVSDAKLILTPLNGNLPHNDDGYVNWQCAGSARLKNFVVIAEFQNPYDGHRQDWDFGVFFRVSSDHLDYYRLGIASKNYWDLGFVSGGQWDELYIDGEVNILNRGPNQKNTIFLIVLDRKAYFFLNQDFIGQLDVSQKLSSGKICVATGVYGNEVKGSVTKFSDFAIWSLP